MLVVHLADFKNGWLGASGLRNDHERLAQYGYDLSACPCHIPAPGVSVRLWEDRDAQIAS